MLLALLALTNFSCTKDYATPEFVDGVANSPTHSINGLMNSFLKNIDNFAATDTIKSATPIYITGYVISEDNAGNIYKSMTIQEENPANGAIAISIDAGNLSGIYPVGQKVTFRCDGLQIGRYGGMPQIGASYVNTASAGRLDLGRIPIPIAFDRIQATGFPDISKAVITELTIAQLLASGNNNLNKLVRIKNVSFTNAGRQTFGMEGTNVRTQAMSDGTGTTNIGTSQYAQFAHTNLPTGRGDIVVIVSKFNTTWQLTLRSLKDLGDGFTFE